MQTTTFRNGADFRAYFNELVAGAQWRPDQRDQSELARLHAKWALLRALARGRRIARQASADSLAFRDMVWRQARALSSLARRAASTPADWAPAPPRLKTALAAARAATRRLPVLALFSGRRLPVLALGATAACLIAASNYFEETSPTTPAGHSASEPVHAQWLEIVRPFSLFSLDAPFLNKAPHAYQARRHSTGGGRQDILTFGKFDQGAPFVRLDIYRFGAEPRMTASFFVDMARQAAESGAAIERAGLPGELTTRFGAFEAAELILAKGETRRGQCYGFRLSGSGDVVSMTGVACGSDERPLDMERLACLIDRVDLIAAGEDTALRAFFTAPFRPNPACSVHAARAREPVRPRKSGV